MSYSGIRIIFLILFSLVQALIKWRDKYTNKFVIFAKWVGTNVLYS